MKQHTLPLAALAVALAAALAACSKQAPEAAALPAPAPTSVAAAKATTPSDHAEGGIAWRNASSDADVDAAFAAAKADAKPVFLYWGAKWCPPCNQVKATLFNRADFIERTRAFVPVYIDGDSPGAQKLGSRFKVSGYPTLLLYKPTGEEVTRLPGEIDPGRWGELLNVGLDATRPVKAVLDDALAGGGALKPNDWRLLAFYSWDTDQTSVLGKEKLAPTLAKLAAACPADQPETAMRLRLKALAALDGKSLAAADLAGRPALLAMLNDPVAARLQADQVANYAADIARAVGAKGTPERTEVTAALDAALKRFQADTTLSRADRMQALTSRVELARIDFPDDAKPTPGKPVPEPKLAAPLLADVRAEVAKADREITDGYERQAVITSAAYLLERAGLSGESDTLLKANLAKSHSPYYLMSGLAGNAKRRGDSAEALRWYREAFEKSEGPATRLQWGASYLGALVELSPADEKSIESTTSQLLKEAATQPDAFEQRSGRQLQKIGTRLVTWSKGGAHAASMGRLRGELDTLCAAPGRTDADRTACRALLTPPPAKASA